MTIATTLSVGAWGRGVSRIGRCSQNDGTFFFPTQRKKTWGGQREENNKKRKKISETMKQRRVVDRQMSVSHRRGVGRVNGGVCVCVCVCVWKQGEICIIIIIIDLIIFKILFAF